MKKIYDVNRNLEIRPDKDSYETSNGGKNRVRLKLIWNTNNIKIAIVIGINPSKANDKELDNTTIKCGRFLDAYGFKSAKMINLFEYVSTPQSGIDKTTRTDFEKFKNELDEVDAIIIAWGIDKSVYKKEKEDALNVLKGYDEKLYCLKTQAGNTPGHFRNIYYDSWELVPYINL